MSNISLWKEDGTEDETGLKNPGELKLKRNLRQCKDRFGVFKSRRNAGNEQFRHYAINGFGSKTGGFAEIVKNRIDRATKSGPVIDRTEELREFYENREKNRDPE